MRPKAAKNGVVYILSRCAIFGHLRLSEPASELYHTHRGSSKHPQLVITAFEQRQDEMMSEMCGNSQRR